MLLTKRRPRLQQRGLRCSRPSKQHETRLPAGFLSLNVSQARPSHKWSAEFTRSGFMPSSLREGFRLQWAYRSAFVYTCACASDGRSCHCETVLPLKPLLESLCRTFQCLLCVINCATRCQGTLCKHWWRLIL